MNFLHGGEYAAAYCKLTNKTEFDSLAIRLKTPARHLAVRFIDSDGQFHQHFFPLSGNGNTEQELTVPLAGAPGSHWGGANDGKLRPPVREIGLVFHRGDFDSPFGTGTFTSIRLQNKKGTERETYSYLPAAPEKFFISPDSAEKLEIRLSGSPQPPGETERSYFYTDYQGRRTGGGTAEYDTATNLLRLEPPQKIGFYDLHFSKLGIFGGVCVGIPAPKTFDQFFAMDGSFSWGGYVSDQDLRSFMRLLLRNGISWNRDRIHWGWANPGAGQYRFDGQFDRYRRIAAEEGMKTLDVFHDTPDWLRDATNTRQGIFPANLPEAARSWKDIVSHWNATTSALEVWNEPDSWFSRNLPAEFPVSLTKAISARFAADQLNCLIIGGSLAWPRETTNIYRSYLLNGLLEDADVLSYHTYYPVATLEKQLIGMREEEYRYSPKRAGIPYWLTECGMPWKRGTERARLADDLHCAAEIVGKALEFRALGGERYFLFVFDYFDETVNNFGTLDKHGFPMRSLGTYLHAAKYMAHKTYIGDLPIPGAVRCRVFSDGKHAIATPYCGLKETRKAFLELPDSLPEPQITGLDGRPLLMEGRRIPLQDGLVYLEFDHNELLPHVKNDTAAMRYYRLSREFKRMPRAAKPLVLQNDSPVKHWKHSNFGYDFPIGHEAEVVVGISNFGGAALAFVPEVTLPAGAEPVDIPKTPISIPANGKAFYKFKVRFTDLLSEREYRHIRIADGGQNATPLVLSVRLSPRLFAEAVKPAVQPDDGWISLLPGDWQAENGAANHCPIRAKFRMIYTPARLLLQVQLKNPPHFRAQPAAGARQENVIRFAIRLQDAFGKKLPRDKIYKFAVSGTPRRAETRFLSGGLSTLGTTVKQHGNETFYEIKIPARALGVGKFAPELTCAFKIEVSDNHGTGRTGFLSWGEEVENDTGEFKTIQFRKN